MAHPTISILTVTLDRFEVATQYFGPALERAGYPFELLSVDNGSADRRVVEYVASFNPVWHCQRKDNVGYAPALNQMLLRAKTDYVCVLDPDIRPCVMSWLAQLVDTYEAVLAEIKPGSTGVRCIFEYDEEMVIAGKTIHRSWNAFGIKFFHRQRILSEVGYYYEGYGRYGCEDNEMNYRLNKSGFTNYYIPGVAEHYDDCGETTPYRMQKWKDLEAAQARWEERRKYMDETGDYYVGPPALWSEGECQRSAL